MGTTKATSRMSESRDSTEPRHYHDRASQSSSSSTPSTDGHLHVGATPTTPSTRPWRRKLTEPAARRIPQPIKKVVLAVVKWIKGPDPPRIWKITPIFPKIQTAPRRLLKRYCPKQKQRFWLLMFFYFCFLLVFVTVLNRSAFNGAIDGYGEPVTLGCVDEAWADKNQCGMDGNDCRPFANSTLAIRCPANCQKDQVLNPHAVGAYEAIYQSLVVGGPPTGNMTVGGAFYRGDSFICAAAVHAGYFSNEEGGCGVVSFVGERADYPSVNQHGISSIGFDSNFPLSFQFLEDAKSSCKDLRWPLLAVTVTFSVLLSLFTTSPAVFFGSIFAGLFFHVALVSDPPSGSDYYSLVSTALGSFLPAAFVAVVVYRYVIKRTLRGLEAQIEKTVLWLGACWVGCLNNQTFDKIPIQRLTPHDLQQQPGAITALVIIVLVIFFIAVGQAWAIRVEGKMPRYLALYAFMGFCLLMFVAIPNMNLRIHHYILALLLLPGTSMQNRPSLLYQGLLVGLFINGIARWGFDSILQTPEALQGDAQLGTELPIINAPVVAANNITFTWQPIPSDFDGISILVNDVERYRGFPEDMQPMNFTWERDIEGHPEYFRFGFMSGSDAGDFTQAGIWQANGTWTQMKDGPSK